MLLVCISLVLSAAVALAVESAHIAKIKVKGMTCSSCAASITKKLESMPGVTSVKVDLKKNHATVKFDHHQEKPDALKEAMVKAINELGYEAHL